jgi:3-deoxy-manno-octulosonate cytidylyltransferase (CMP-KDO synthetase)
MAGGFKVAIPARYASTRLPGKPLRPLAGRPMIEHVYERALASGADEVVIATDDDRIRTVAEGFGARVCMTAPDHPSGTDRLAEVAERLDWPAGAIVVNLQGDEPLMPPALVRQAAEDLAAHPDAGIATLCTPIDELGEVFDADVVKVVRDEAGYALYFSRAPVPWERAAFGTAGAPALGGGHLRHIGLYAYRVRFLRRYRQLSPSPLEQAEALEQLRALWHGVRIHVSVAVESPGPGVDTEKDVARVEGLLSSAAKAPQP